MCHFLQVNQNSLSWGGDDWWYHPGWSSLHRGRGAILVLSYKYCISCKYFIKSLVLAWHAGSFLLQVFNNPHLLLLLLLHPGNMIRVSRAVVYWVLTLHAVHDEVDVECDWSTSRKYEGQYTSNWTARSKSWSPPARYQHQSPSPCHDSQGQGSPSPIS